MQTATDVVRVLQKIREIGFGVEIFCHSPAAAHHQWVCFAEYEGDRRYFTVTHADTAQPCISLIEHISMKHMGEQLDTKSVSISRYVHLEDILSGGPERAARLLGLYQFLINTRSLCLRDVGKAYFVYPPQVGTVRACLHAISRLDSADDPSTCRIIGEGADGLAMSDFDSGRDHVVIIRNHKGVAIAIYYCGEKIAE